MSRQESIGSNSIIVLYRNLWLIVDCSVRQDTPAGKATAEDPAGTRRLRRCPRQGSACSGNQLLIYSFHTW
ncbi:MAG: hypothetical protein LRY73_08525 [Bacillus sp. (in: Bacteria)]|nr:hypothetical protein [Bacillus sp. (in: firmicutes)]